MVRRFDLLVVDMDGTLVDSEAQLVGLVNETLRLRGCPQAEAGAVAATIGLPLAEVFARAVPSIDAPAIEALCRDYRRRADAMEFVRGFRLFPGVSPTLHGLRRSGTRVVVATSKGRATSLDILEHCAIRAVVDDVIGGDCVTRGKPHREMVDQARARFGATEARTLVVGDTSFDIEMGKSAGVATCAVTYGMHREADLRSLGPTFVIDRFEALLGLFDAAQ